MNYLLVSTCAAAMALASVAAQADEAASPVSAQSCAMGYVTGVGGSNQSIHEYLAASDRDKYRYVAENPIQCKVSDDGRATDCTGVTNLKREKVSVYDDVDSATIAVVARIELDHGDVYPAIIVVPRADVKCTQ